MVSIRQRLLRELVIAILVLAGGILTTTFVGSRRAIATLSGVVIDQAMETVEARLGAFLDPALVSLRLAETWDAAAQLDPEDLEGVNRMFLPLLVEYPQMSSLIVADDSGREYLLMRTATGWLNRLSRPEEWGERTYWREWSERQDLFEESWREFEYDARTRPWFLSEAATRAQPSPKGAGRIRWTDPYIFATTRELGITASTRYEPEDGEARVLGVDLLLTDISKFTTQLQIGRSGLVAVSTEDRRLIGLPGESGLADPATWGEALLRRPRDLGITVLEDAAEAAAGARTGSAGPIRFTSDGVVWWGRTRPFRLGPDRTLHIAVLVPDADIFPGRNRTRLGILALTALLLGLSVLRAAQSARRLSQPIEAVVAQSERISKGDLEEGEPIDTAITEVKQLVAAQDGMRRGLQTLMKLERDLQIARQIQQSTFPSTLPQLRGFDLVAWSEPADETGGDTYDVIALPNPDGGDEPNRVILLLADATGHGIGPALVATQSRAMVRMALHMSGDLPRIAERLNQQLFADLPSNRFITLWMGDLDLVERTLTSFSAGQAPLLRLSGTDKRCDLLGSDTTPFGMFPMVKFSEPKARKMGTGDIFAVISDGIYEASNSTGEEFGEERVAAVFRDNHEQTAAEILAALRQSVETFTEGRPADDDRTVLIIKAS
jgi:serine phosphatase RsbU (regulator of sigma subunit)